MQIEIRDAREGDVHAIAQLYRDVYGEDYPFKSFYDPAWIKRGVFDREIRWFVAQTDAGRLLGSAAIMMRAGDADDQIGELGRLVVHPDARGHRLGSRLVAALTEVADRACDFAFAECRTAHVGSQKIFAREGFHVVGIEPLCYRLGDYETVTFVVRLSETARVLRKPRPTVLPDAYELASGALQALSLPDDVSVADPPVPLPTRRSGDLLVEPMDDQARYRLLRMGREAALSPDVFGAMRLAHGHLKLEPAAAEFLVLRRGDVVLGGLGYTWDEVDRKLRLFQLAGVDPHAKGTLLTRGVAWLEATHDPRYLVVDVSAYASATQATLHQLGFAPVIYAPSMVYGLGERFDVCRMVKLRMEPDLAHWRLTETSRPTAELAQRALLEVQKGTVGSDGLRQVALFSDLTDQQLGAVAALCREARYEPGEAVFRVGDDDQSLHLVIQGAVRVHAEGEADRSVGRGEVFGEAGLVAALPRRVGAEATQPTIALVISADDFDHLLAAQPQVGARILRKLAQALATR